MFNKLVITFYYYYLILLKILCLKLVPKAFEKLTKIGNNTKSVVKRTPGLEKEMRSELF